MMENKKTIPVNSRKVAIIGAGYVGASIAYALTLRNLAREIVLIDKDYSKAQGEARDIQHGIPYMGIASTYCGNYSDCADCDIIIITAGRNRRPGETRLNMISDNSAIMKSVVENIMPYYTRGVILVVSNPVDIMVSLCARWMGLPNGMIVGTGTILDTSRLVRRVADYVNISTEVVKAIIVGEHGDSQIPIWSRATVGGISIAEYCTNSGLLWNKEQQDKIAEEVRKMGATIISDKGKTHFGIATCVCFLADAILNQRPTISTVSTPLQGEYGIKDVALSLPSIIGVNGVERRLEETWSKQEVKAFQLSAEKLRNTMLSLGPI